MMWYLKGSTFTKGVWGMGWWGFLKILVKMFPIPCILKSLNRVKNQTQIYLVHL